MQDVCTPYGFPASALQMDGIVEQSWKALSGLASVGAMPWLPSMTHCMTTVSYVSPQCFMLLTVAFYGSQLSVSTAG